MTITHDGAVHQTVTVPATPDDAFAIFTDDFDSWWPHTHHIGKSPMTKGLIEGWVGGRCYSEQEDGTDCPWGQILVWEPPHRLVIAWQVTPEWGFNADLARSSEVEVTFTAVGNRQTRVDLVHRHFERMGPQGGVMRARVDSPGGWGTLLNLYAARTAAAAPEGEQA